MNVLDHNFQDCPIQSYLCALQLLSENTGRISGNVEVKI